MTDTITTEAPVTLPPSPLSRAADNKPANRTGMAARGAYPDVSRTKLARVLGVHTSTVSNYLTGRTEMPLGLAEETARVLGVGVGELVGELMRRRREWQAGGGGQGTGREKKRARRRAAGRRSKARK